jgi:osmoprotectant transport system permease protein
MHFLRQVIDWFFTASHWQGSAGIPHRVLVHMAMSAAAVAAAIVVALPIALWLGHVGRGGYAAISLANIGRAVPSFALLVIGFEIFGLGSKPVFLALFALSVPPIVTNTYVAIRQVDPDIKEAAVGLGMTGGQVLVRAELPVGVPLIFAGIRTAAVQAVATAAIGAVIGGIAQQDHVEVVAGAVIIAVLSLLTEVGLAAVQRAATPGGLQVSEPTARRVATLPGVGAAGDQ